METENESHPGAAYAVIPSYVLYCRDIEQGAKLLYAQISVLANSKGYCWASNSYLAEIHDVDESTIKRWINSLKEQNFITLETKNIGFKKVRHIWITEEFQRMFTKAQKRADRKAQKRAYRGLKNEPSIYKDEEENKLIRKDTSEVETSTENRAKALPSATASGVCSIFFATLKKSYQERTGHEFSKNPNLEKWASTFDKMLRLDKISEERILAIIPWVFEHDFWNAQILSPEALRKQFSTLEVQKANQSKTAQVKVFKDRVNNNRRTYFAEKKRYPESYKHTDLIDNEVINNERRTKLSLDMEEEVFIAKLKKSVERYYA